MRKLIVGIAVVGIVALGAATMGERASAGEITGTGKDTPPNGYKAASICSFSGLNDDYLAGASTYRTQTPGNDEGVGPFKSFTGFACNPNNGFGE